MAVKSSLVFLLALSLLVSNMAIALEQVHNMACAPPMQAPVQAPLTPPVSSPPPQSSAPPVASSPPESSVLPPVSSPPPESLVPVPPVFIGHHGCAGLCFKHCRRVRPYRPCMRACGGCCNKSLCVPSSMKCDDWDSVVIHGKIVKCP